jgi:8-hydroxy-5-deazaflavin:NADPH oxidoreductase
MNMGVLGTGMVGEAIATKLVSLGHRTMIGSRSATNEKALAWMRKTGEGASVGTFADAASSADIVWNCTSGVASLDALSLAGTSTLDGKILVDVANPLDFSKGMPPRLAVANDDSLGEQIQRAFPSAKVVKTLNTINCDVMVDATRVPGEHTVFICGDDGAAKAEVEAILRQGFGWREIMDLGGITSARATEAYVLLWIRMWGSLGTSVFNVRVVRG